MTDHLRLHDAGDDITRALRRRFAAPEDEAYWDALEERIRAHVRGGRGLPPIAWFEELDRWARPAIVAAAVLLLAAGVAIVRDRQLAEASAYAGVFTPTTLPVEAAVRPVLQEPRDATLRYLISP